MSFNSNENNQKENKTSFLKSLPKTQRNAFLGLSFLSFFILILWIWQFNFNLSSPFSVPDQGDDLRDVEVALSDFGSLITEMDANSDNFINEEIEEDNNFLNIVIDEPVSNLPDLGAWDDPLEEPGLNSDGIGGALESMLLGQASAAQLRLLLADVGADASLLEQLSDEELLAVYQEILAEQELDL